MHKVAIGCDPNAVNEKKALIKYLTEKGYELTDLGSDDPIYANIAIKVGAAVASGEYDRGILICGTGIGVSLAANKVPGVLAALVSDVYSAERARKSNDANPPSSSLVAPPSPRWTASGSTRPPASEPLRKEAGTGG